VDRSAYAGRITPFLHHRTTFNLSEPMLSHLELWFRQVKNLATLDTFGLIRRTK